MPPAALAPAAHSGELADRLESPAVRRNSRYALAGVAVIVVAGSFWTANSFAAAYGRGRALDDWRHSSPTGFGTLSVPAAMLMGMGELIWRRVYGADHDDPDPGPRTGHVYRELVGGPLDGLLLDVTGWTNRQLQQSAALVTEIGRFGPGGRALYGPRAGDPEHWDWEGDTR